MLIWRKKLETWSKPALTATSITIVAVVGWMDYLTGYQLFFFIFYLLAVFLAVWYVNSFAGVLISALSVASWVSSDYAAGKHYTDYFTPAWNALIMFAFYLVVVVLMAKLRELQRGLEGRVRLRTAELTKEIHERMRLQKELLETGEREQQRIGRDLHDGLCQHLTGTAFAGHALSRKLADRSLPETTDANRLVELVEQAIELTRTLARGLHPVEMHAGRLTDCFEELAANARERLKVDCEFECGSLSGQPDANVANHLYRIAQEAITNAVRHGKAQHVAVRLTGGPDGLVLTIADDGVGLPENARNGNGMGLRIMAYRADMMGGTFNAERQSVRGTRLTCTVPSGNRRREDHDKEN